MTICDTIKAVNSLTDKIEIAFDEAQMAEDTANMAYYLGRYNAYMELLEALDSEKAATVYAGHENVLLEMWEAII